MKRSIRLIIAVAIVGLSIGAYFLVTNWPERESDEPLPLAERYQLVDSRESELSYMSFERNEGPDLLFEKIEQGEGDDKETVWTVASPKIVFEVRDRDIKDIAYSMASVSTDQIIEEEPSDLSIYGLDNPSAKAEIGIIDETPVTFFVGNRTPTRSSYYVLVDGDPIVYAVRTYTIDKVFTDLDDLRDRQITLPDKQAISYFRLEGEDLIEIVKMEEDDNFIGSQFSTLKLARPYRTERSIDTQRFSEMVETIPAGLTIERFIDDQPTDFAQYGLDPPVYDWTMRDEESFIRLLIGGDAGEDQLYVKYPDQDNVFTLAKSVLPFLDTEAFTLADKFVMIPNIDFVDRFTIETTDALYTSEIKRERNLSAQEGEDEEVIETYFLNDVEIEEDPYKKFYQLVIGLLMDEENPEPQRLDEPDVTIMYYLNEKGPVETAKVEFVQINRDFYAVLHDGYTEFLLSSYQINAMLEKAEELISSS